MPWRIDEFATNKLIILIRLLEPPQIEAIFQRIRVNLYSRIKLFDELLCHARIEQEAMDICHVALSFVQHFVDISDILDQILLNTIDRFQITAYSQRNKSHELLRPLFHVESNAIIAIHEAILM
jgi:hypothetical protein